MKSEIASAIATGIINVADAYEPDKFKMPTRKQWTDLVELAQIYLTVGRKRKKKVALGRKPLLTPT